LTLFQANLLVAMLAGFWGRQADGHPGPDLMGRGLLILTALVQWEKSKKQRPLENAHRKQPHRKPGRSASLNDGAASYQGEEVSSPRFGRQG
jgi:hypothetical protein